MYFGVYLDVSFYVILKKGKFTSQFVATLENTINKLN